MPATRTTARMFQSTPPRGRRPPPAAALALVSSFNPRLRAGGDAHSTIHDVEDQLVSIHASAREATDGAGTMLHRCRLFQSTPPRGRRLSIGDGLLGILEFQSTPPRGRRLKQAKAGNIQALVSIHASAREATRPRSTSSTPTTRFQSTPPRGRRRPATRSVRPCRTVSIHASAREATRRGWRSAR